MRKPSKKFSTGTLVSMAVRWATAARSAASCTLPAASIVKPVMRQVMTSLWSPKMESAWVARARAETWNTPGRSSPAILNMFGSIRRSPWDAVKVLARAPAESAPWIAPAAPPSDCISVTLTVLPKMFLRPWAAHSSMCSGMGDEGVIG